MHWDRKLFASVKKVFGLNGFDMADWLLRKNLSRIRGMLLNSGKGDKPLITLLKKAVEDSLV